jgi:enoyl-CoA hydratase/carnithine racemase
MNADRAQLVTKAISPGYWRATFDNPPINVVGPDLFIALHDLVDEIDADPDVKVIVFDSADEDYFLAHFDMLSQSDVPRRRGASGLPLWIDITSRLSRSPVVSIAEIRGRARGVGSEFALACDMRFASTERAVLGQPEIGAGVIAGGGAAERLPHLVGRARALVVLLGGEDFDAETAERYGYVNRAIPDAQLGDFVDALARRLASFDHRALAETKRLVSRTGLPADDVLLESSAVFAQALAWPEVRQRVTNLVRHGLQTRGDLEHDLGGRIATAALTPPPSK